MPVSVNQVKQIVDTIANKNQSGIWSTAEYNTIFAAVNYDFLKYRIGLPELYQVGNPQPPVSYQITQKITDDVRFLIKKVDIVKDSNGYFPIPADYFAFSSWRYKYIENSDCGEAPYFKDYPIETLSDNELVDALDNTIAPPTLVYPKLAYYGLGALVYPQEINRVICTYVRTPVTPVWGYTLVDDEPIYNSALSTDFEYPSSCLNDLSILCLKYLGINIRDESLVNSALVRQKDGV